MQVKYPAKPTQTAVAHFEQEIKRLLAAHRIEKVQVVLRDRLASITSTLNDVPYEIPDLWLEEIRITMSGAQEVVLNCGDLSGLEIVEQTDKKVIWNAVHLIQEALYRKLGRTADLADSGDPYSKLWDHL